MLYEAISLVYYNNYDIYVLSVPGTAIIYDVIII